MRAHPYLSAHAKHFCSLFADEQMVACDHLDLDTLHVCACVCVVCVCMCVCVCVVCVCLCVCVCVCVCVWHF